MSIWQAEDTQDWAAVDPYTDPYTEDGSAAVAAFTGGGVAEVFDITGDGVPDAFVEAMADGAFMTVTDEDGDTLADTLGMDFDGDGVFEVLVTQDVGGYRVQADEDGDGVFESETFMTRDSVMAVDPVVVQALDMQFAAEQAGGTAGVDDTAAADAAAYDGTYVEEGQLVGDPAGDSEHWFEQAANGFCVPASVAQIVSEYTGVDYFDEQYFVERANELHVFVVGPDGVPGLTDTGALALLEDAGVPASIEFGTGVDTLVDYLEEGRRVIVAVDSGEIWFGEQTEDLAADHAVVVTGVDLERGVVILSDPGDPAGNAAEYPIDVFEGAWEDSGFTAIVCDESPEEYRSETVAAAAAPQYQQAPELASGRPWAMLPVVLGGAA